MPAWRLILLAFALWVSPALAQETRAYGEDARQTLDLYGGDDLKGAPVLLHIPGGGWATQDKAMAWSIPDFARRRDILLAVMDYRAPPEVMVDDQAADVAAAIAWLKAHAAEYGGDPDKIFLMGHSAGGHLAALVGVDPAYLREEGLDLGDLAGVILLDGAAYDARLQADYLESYYGSPQGASHIFGPILSVFTPADLVRGGQNTPPFLILYPSQRAYAIRQVRALEEAFDRAGVEYETVSVSGTYHVSIAMDFGEIDSAAGRAAGKFIRHRAR